MAEKNGYQKADSGSYRKLDGDDVIDLGTLFWNIIQGFLKFWWLVILLMAIGAGAFYLKASRIDLFYADVPIVRHFHRADGWSVHGGFR